MALDLSYGIPILINCLRGRNALPERKWKLPRTIGWMADIVSVEPLIKKAVLIPTGIAVVHCLDHRFVRLSTVSQGDGQ